MTHLEGIPPVLAAAAIVFLVIGSTLTFLGTLGLVRLRNFYDRLHAPTLGTSWGAAGVLLASILVASWGEGRVVLHELVIGIFVMITTPVTLLMLGRAALHRDRAEGRPDVPPGTHPVQKPVAGETAGEGQGKPAL
ncbi:monovalent cation/H(+) antiporter subunit G [Neotabrizicola sp. VNH66]|uniref:monovalent cation/H(+) antiporter subunit G n=1 Tax=Neotabrizicola sp. VNH66 TaxID=3400918 RepID=UPI003C0567F9